MVTKERARLFLAMMDQISNIIEQAERIAWDEINSYEDCNDERANCGWAMQSIASHMNWWIYNSNNYAEEWETIERGAQ